MDTRGSNAATKQRGFPEKFVYAAGRQVISVIRNVGRKKVFNLGGSLILLLLPSIVLSQVTAHHTVTVVVQTITLLQINVGTVALNITGAGLIAGQNQMTATDQSTTISWGTNSSLKKITVNTNLAAPIFAMKVLALNPTVGTAATEVTLSTVASDLIINIGRSSGTSSLQYTGVALASQGVGKDTHSITYTIQSQ